MDVIRSTPKNQANATWRESKSIGDVGEKVVAMALQAMGFNVEHGEPTSSGLDLRVEVAVEVKTCPRAIAFGRIFIEFSDNNKASGLSISTANAWAVVIGEEILLIATARLRLLVEKYPKRQFHLTCGRQKTGTLVPLDVLRRNSLLLEGRP